MSNKALIAMVIGICAVATGAVLIFTSKDNSTKNVSMDNYSYSTENSPTPQQPAPAPEPTPAATSSSATEKTFVELSVKNFGKVKIELSSETPKTSENFRKLVSDGFYNNLTFHRVIPGFVAQGGDPQGDGTGGPGYTVPAEIKLKHTRGAIAMARTGDNVNPKRESSGSQFYIALQDLPDLDGAYTVFGHVVEGMDVVDKIAKVETDMYDKPVTPVVIEKAVIIK